MLINFNLCHCEMAQCYWPGNKIFFCIIGCVTSLENCWRISPYAWHQLFIVTKATTPQLCAKPSLFSQALVNTAYLVTAVFVLHILSFVWLCALSREWLLDNSASSLSELLLQDVFDVGQISFSKLRVNFALLIRKRRGGTAIQVLLPWRCEGLARPV